MRCFLQFFSVSSVSSVAEFFATEDTEYTEEREERDTQFRQASFSAGDPICDRRKLLLQEKEFDFDITFPNFLRVFRFLRG